MNAQNKHAGYCKHCGKFVPKGTGYQFFWNGKWEISHSPRCPDSGTCKDNPTWIRKEN